MSWASGIRVDGEFSIANGDVNQLMAVYTRDFNMTGSVNTDGTFILQGDCSITSLPARGRKRRLLSKKASWKCSRVRASNSGARRRARR